MYTIDFNSPVHVHFIGIGGISMSGLAEVLQGRGFTVTGSDNTPSEQTRHLEDEGIIVSFPQSADNVTDDIDVVVYTAAIHPDNPEYAACEKKGLPMLTRAQLLGQMMAHYDRSIAVAGTHGKTTTTSMIGQILLEGKDEPTISVGGIFQAIHSNIHVGNSDLFLTEACEYTNSYHEFYPKYNVILNIEADHMDFFKDLEDIRASFKRFAENTKNGGVLAINAAIPRLGEITADVDADVVSFGLLKDGMGVENKTQVPDYTAKDISYDDEGHATFTPVAKGEALKPVHLGVPGEHNVANALAAIAITREMGIPDGEIMEGLSKFHGAERRFEYKGTYHGAVIIDDYAHHPSEIAASIAAARKMTDKHLIVLFQPHTYTRTKAFLDDFAKELAKADEVGLCKIYEAREQDIYGVSSVDILERIKKIGTPCRYFPTFEEAEEFYEKKLSKNDLLITMGAGNVVKIGEDLLRE